MGKFLKVNEPLPVATHTHPECDELYAALIHGHELADVSGLVSALSGKVSNSDPRLSDARIPKGGAGGVLSGTYPNPGFAVDMVEQSELAAALATREASLGNPSANGHLLSSTTTGVRSWVPPPTGGSVSVSTMRKTADQSFTTTAYSDVSGLSFPVLANTDYAFDFTVVWSSAAATTGVAFALNGPASPVMFFAPVETATSATAMALRQDTAYDQGTASASIDLANTNRLCRIKGVLRNGPNAGNLTVRCKSEVANSAITVKRGSWGTYF